MNEFATMEMKRDFGAYEESVSEDGETNEHEEIATSNFEQELLSAIIADTDDEWYTLASEGVDDDKYLKMKSNSSVSDYPSTTI